MNSNVRVEEFLQVLGRKGRYEICQYFWLFLSMITVSFGSLGYIFVGKSVTHQCATLSAQSIANILASLGIPAADVVGIDTNYYKCSVDVTVNTVTSSQTVEVECLDGQDFGDILFTSVISEFGLVCDRRVLGVLPKIVVIATQAVGSLTLPVLADYVGRKPVLIGAQALSLMLMLSQAFIRNIDQFLILKALSGVFIDGAHLVSFTMALELTLDRDRKYIAVLFGLGWFLGSVTLVGVSYGFRLDSWRSIQYFTAGGSLFVFVQILVVEESIRWLFAVGRNEEALQLVVQAAEVNHVDINKTLSRYHARVKTPRSSESNEPSSSAPYSTAETSPDTSSTENPSDVTPTSPEHEGASTTTAAVPTTSLSGNTTPAETPMSGTPGPGIATSPRATLVKAENPEDRGCCGIIKSKRLLRETVIFAYVWFAVGFSFLSLYLAETVLADNLYLNFSVNVLSELPAGIIFLVAVDRIGRKNTMFMFFGIALGFLFACTLVKVLADVAVQTYVVPVCGLIGKSGIAGLQLTLFLYTGESFPTSSRLIGLGTSSLAAKFGNLGAPFVFFFEEEFPWLQTTLIVILLLIATFAIFPLPETKGNDLPESVADEDDLYNT
ncbi:solute carrier family 22 member 2-like [Haliotis rufescens]|uniref:solute carrier family 22 member 2-like n=1 Tax=Haliotis rufescens TaxID=6454 RepID=UPI00201F84D8|nr:solute carrier family 22 member 2-like [Haliotis rufescens]